MHHRLHRWILAPALTAALVGPALAEGEGAAEALATITAAELEDHVAYLASDELEGRGTGSEGERRAAAYLIERFKAAGLEPGSAEGTFLQPFTVPGPARVQGEPALSMRVGPWRRAMEGGADFTPFSFSASGELEDLPLVFAGYGVTDPQRGYDDYAGLDVTGKAVIVLRHEPREQDGVGEHSYFTRKAENARAHGAAAILVVTDPLHHQGDDALMPFNAGGSEDLGIPAFHLKQSVAQGLFRLAGQDLTEVQRGIDRDLKPASFALDADVSLSVAIERRALDASNVVAKIPGTDPALADEVVVIGAHYDHLGRGSSGTSLDRHGQGKIHNGADDNASGTSALLELAQAFALAPPRRTIYLVAFSGEELGLLGSRHFVEHPPVPRERIAAMVNLDMIGRLGDEPLEVGGVGSSPGFEELVRGVASEQGVKVTLSKSGYGPSDHASFYGAGVPVLFFFTGLHGEYHRPDDDAHLVDHAGAEKVTRAAYACAEAIANADARPEYVAQRRSRQPRAVLGIRIDQRFDGEGAAVASVSGPAAAAGLEAGDVIVALDATQVGDVRALLAALAEHEPGDEVRVTVRRGEESLVLPVTLGRR